MKKSLLIIISFLLAFNLKAQTTDEFSKYAEKVEKQRSEYWKTKEFGKAADLLKNSIVLFNSQPNEVRTQYASYNSGVLYNIACALSLNNQKDSSLAYLQKAIQAGYADYNNAKNDTDFNNVKDDPKFKEMIASLREKGDYDYILKKHGTYNSLGSEIPEFTFQPKETKELEALRKKYNLDDVAGNGSEISRQINLMKWVHNVVKHDGNSVNPSNRTADAIIEICSKEKRGVNCRMMATILNEVYLSMGYKSRFITCMPKGEIFDDCHVINEVYNTELKKWIWMDPTFETTVTDDKGNYLSIQETRYRLVNDLPVKASEGINWNGKPYGGGGETYLHSYMTKNLFRFSILLNSQFGTENVPFGKRTYVELYPEGYNPKIVEFGKKTMGTIYTSDDKQYWKVPKE